jgi:hypothetical protein
MPKFNGENPVSVFAGAGGTPNGTALSGVPAVIGGEPKLVIPAPIGLVPPGNGGCCGTHGSPGHSGNADGDPAKNGSVM